MPRPKNKNRFSPLVSWVANLGGSCCFLVRFLPRNLAQFLPRKPKLQVLASYAFVPMSHLEPHVEQMVTSWAEIVHEAGPFFSICHLPGAKPPACPIPLRNRCTQMGRKQLAILFHIFHMLLGRVPGGS